MKTMIDEEGHEVEGGEIKRVWKEAFEKLGKKGGQEPFDEKFTESVENEEEEIEQTNKEREAGELNEKIRLEEVRKIINRLKNGKAAGVDGIVNEIIKHGGEQVHVAMWQLIDICFEEESTPED